MHIVELIERYLAEHGDRVRAVDHTGSWTGAQLSRRARHLAGGLRNHGVRQGDRVGVMMANCVDVFVAYEAAWRAGRPLRRSCLPWWNPRSHTCSAARSRPR